MAAHPLAIDSSRRLDEERQRALTRHYLASGIGGLAIGVHTTQFLMHERSRGLYEPVLALGAEEMNRASRPVVRVAGVLGPTERAVAEAEVAARYGYDAALVVPVGWQGVDQREILAGFRAVAELMPVFGFALQPAVGGAAIDYRLWRELAEVPRLIAVKVAPFDRYQTIEVVRALAEAGRLGPEQLTGAKEPVALYTGNDDAIVADLVTPLQVAGGKQVVTARFVGALLGQFAMWTPAAVELFALLRAVGAAGLGASSELLAVGAELTDANGAIFDARNRFAGSIAGVQEVLVREGLLEGRWCLDPRDDLSIGQEEEITRVWNAYPHLRDPALLRERLAETYAAVAAVGELPLSARA